MRKNRHRADEEIKNGSDNENIKKFKFELFD